MPKNDTVLPNGPSAIDLIACVDECFHVFSSDDQDHIIVKDVCNSVTFLEDTAGLKSFREEATMKMDECLDWDEDSEGDEDF